MNFDTVINRRGTNSSKWDKMEKLYGVSNKTGISMWVADMDFNPPSCIQEALKKYTDHAVYGYYGDDRAYREAICWWQKNRHDWSIDPHWIFSTHGLVNGTALCIDAFTNPNEGVVLFPFTEISISLLSKSPLLNLFLKLSLVATLALFPTIASRTLSSASFCAFE